MVKIIGKQKKVCNLCDILAPSLSFSALLAVCSLVGAIASTVPALAMPQGEMAQTPQGQNLSQRKTLYVSSSRGNDSGDGSQLAPLRTITQALKFAEPKTVILLTPGTYSAATGEVFPLILKPEVTLQGNPFDRGQSVIIEGGGDFVSPTLARQNITILAEAGSRLSGVTVTNSNYRGRGLWIESSSPVVAKNTFLANTYDGISVAGNSAPIVIENNFRENGAAGINIYANSQPEIRDNLFEKNSFGIKVDEDAAPVVVGNRIVDNQDGILIQGKARPAIRGNYIERNVRDGIVAMARSLPDLGHSEEPGRNTIRNNGRYDLHNGTDNNIIPAFGNIFGSDRLSGRFDLAGTTAPARAVSPIRSENRPNSSRNETAALTIFDGSLASGARSNGGREAAVGEGRILDRVLPSRNRASVSEVETSSADAIEIPVPLPDSGDEEAGAKNTDWEERLHRRIRGNGDRNRSGSEAVERPVSQRPRRSRPSRWLRIPSNRPSSDRSTSCRFGSCGQRRETRPASDGLLPVPGANIPLGSGGYVPPELRGVANSLPNNSRRSGSGNRPLALGLRYRVVVNVRGRREESRLRAIVPDAFEKSLNGQSVMQAGAFRDRGEADQLLSLLKRNGLNARIVPFR
ncbi:MAG: DUF1565 domain-containing protein [Cyanobacteriota bacterium]|nr:DUF1565 domain-containing protein [Cyanobacteriota bacterium]